MIITITKTSDGLKLYSYNPHFIEYIGTNSKQYADYHKYNYSMSNAIYCYDVALFEIMSKISDHFNNIKKEEVVFDVE